MLSFLKILACVNKTFSKAPLILWMLANLFFAFQFILRLSAGILREEIIQNFSIDTIAFGTLAGYYYLGYAGMQIPIGIMLDKFNFRIVIFVSILITSIGTLAFASGSNFYYLLAGRFLIGAGSAAGFLSVAKIIKTYFPPKNHSLMLGFSFTFGLLGAVFGVTPMKILFLHFGYYNTFYTLALIGFIIGILILFLKSNEIYEDSHETGKKTNIIKLLSNPKILLIGISGGLMVGALEGFADIWAIPFFKQVYLMTDVNSNIITSFVYIGMCFGGPILTIIADLSKSPTMMIIITGLLITLIFGILLYLPELSFLSSSILMFCLGIVCCYQVLVFDITSKSVSKQSVGLAIAIINCINMAFGHFFHKVMSILISFNWDGELNKSYLPIYSRENFILAISSIPIFCLVGVGGFVYLNFRKNRQRALL